MRSGRSRQSSLTGSPKRSFCSRRRAEQRGSLKLQQESAAYMSRARFLEKTVCDRGFWRRLCMNVLAAVESSKFAKTLNSTWTHPLYLSSVPLAQAVTFLQALHGQRFLRQKHLQLSSTTSVLCCTPHSAYCTNSQIHVQIVHRTGIQDVRMEQSVTIEHVTKPSSTCICDPDFALY